jgi:transposase
VECPDCGVRVELVPWARPGSRFTRPFEEMTAYLETKLTNGRTEGFNNKLRMVARRAFGFHGAGALIGMLFLCCGGVTVAPPLPGPWCNW